MTEAANKASHGRGGAGNINSRPSNNGVTAQDLETPTIKQQTYTTGRGGSGNMMSNDNPENARLAQDVTSPAAHDKEARGTFHWGRGGEGNKMTVGGGDIKKSSSKERSKSNNAGERRPSFQGAVQKGKEMLGMGKKSPRGSPSRESAVEETK